MSLIVWRRGNGLIIKPRGLNNKSVWGGQPRGAAICHSESGVPLSPIVECGGRLMKACWFLQGRLWGSRQKPLRPSPTTPPSVSHIHKSCDWQGSQVSGGKPGKVSQGDDAMASTLSEDSKEKDWGEKTMREKKNSSMLFFCLRVWELNSSYSALQGQIVIVLRPLTLSAGVWVCLAFVEKGCTRSRTGAEWVFGGLKDRADVVRPPRHPVPPVLLHSLPRGKSVPPWMEEVRATGRSLWHNQHNRAALVSMASLAASLSRLSVGHKIWLCAPQAHRQHGPLFSLLIAAELCTALWIRSMITVRWSFRCSFLQRSTYQYVKDDDLWEGQRLTREWL